MFVETFPLIHYYVNKHICTDHVNVDCQWQTILQTIYRYLYSKQDQVNKIKPDLYWNI